ncbi:MAG TPA: hypothetical protein VGB15_06870 [Longimicrobium sp.]|jgi:hypothetical protein
MRIAASALLILALVAPSHALAQEPPSDREYAVWSAVIDTALVSPRVRRVVVQDTTVPGDRRRATGPFERRSLTRQRDATPLPAELLEAFAHANEAPSRLDPARFRTKVRVQVLSQAGSQNLPARDDHDAWSEMRDGGFKGSSGVVKLSRVGFTGDGRTALVFVSYYCGGLCAEETYYVLELGSDGGWRVTRLYTTSVS